MYTHAQQTGDALQDPAVQRSQMAPMPQFAAPQQPGISQPLHMYAPEAARGGFGQAAPPQGFGQPMRQFAAPPPSGFNANLQSWLGGIGGGGGGGNAAGDGMLDGGMHYQQQRDQQRLAELQLQQQAIIARRQAELDLAAQQQAISARRREADQAALAALTATTSLSEDHQFLIEESTSPKKREASAAPRSPQPSAASKNGVFVVENILAHRGDGARKEVLVQWRGYGNKHNSWVPADAILNVTDSVGGGAEESSTADAIPNVTDGVGGGAEESSTASSSSAAAPPEKLYVVEQLVSRRRRGGRDEVLVKWSGFSDSHNSWEPRSSARALQLAGPDAQVHVR